jgi:hypothetical protein
MIALNEILEDLKININKICDSLIDARLLKI